MESALRQEIENRIPELRGEIYPTNAPETSIKPYLVYARITTSKIKDLEGFTGKEHLSFMYSIMATRYKDMKSLTKKVEDFLVSLPRKSIGEDKSIFVEDIDINNVHEVYEFDLKVNRGIIDFTIYY